MKIYDKDLRQIFNELPVLYRVMVVCGLAFIAFTVVYLAYYMIMKPARVSPDRQPGVISVGTAKAAGLLDPSLAHDPASATTYMAYTALRPGGEIAVSIAQSPAPCTDWQWRADAFSSRSEALLAPDGVTEIAQGTGRYETPSLVHDAQDAAAPWKIFAYRYFWSQNGAGFAQRYSAIVMKTAADPLGPWSQEQWILSAAPDYPPQPYQSLVKTHANGLSPALAGFSAYARPSVVENNGVLLMTLSAFRGKTTPDSVVLLASTDHGRSWFYISTPLSPATLAATGQKTLSGATLLKQAGGVYLAAVLGDGETQGLGTYIYPFADLVKGQLATDAQGRYVQSGYIARQSVAPTQTGGGYAGFSESCPQGIITSELSGLRNNWQLFRTMQQPAAASE